MEITPYRVIDEPLLLYRYIACLMLENRLFMPFAFKRVLSIDCIRVPKLAIEERIALEHLFLLALLYFLHFRHFFASLLLLSLLLQFFVFTHKF